PVPSTRPRPDRMCPIPGPVARRCWSADLAHRVSVQSAHGARLIPRDPRYGEPYHACATCHIPRRVTLWRAAALEAPRTPRGHLVGRLGEGGYAARAGRATGPPVVVLGTTGSPPLGPIVGICRVC